MTFRSRIGRLLFCAGVFGNLLASCEAVEGCEYTGSCPGGGAGSGGVESLGRGGTAAGASGGGGGNPAGGAIGGGASGGSLGEAGSGATSQAGEAGAPSGTGGRAGSHAGAPSDAGAGGRPPCDGACGGASPICDESSQLCVECLVAADCNAQARACDPITKRCAACLTDTHCGSSAPACNLETQTCVACTRDSHCPSTTPLCNVISHTCVACLSSANCASAAASRCDAGTCKPCSAASDCSQIAGKGLCDQGSCVECTTANEAPCAGKSCNPATRGCTTTAVASVNICEPCIADSECVGSNLSDPDARCIPMLFAGAALPGGFCLRRAVKTCARPFSSALTKVSLSLAPSDTYCDIDQSLTRCPAVLDLIAGRTCATGQDAACGCRRNVDGSCSAPGQGGLCRTVGINPSSCTYRCGTFNQCPTGTTCTLDTAYCH